MQIHIIFFAISGVLLVISLIELCRLISINSKTKITDGHIISTHTLVSKRIVTGNAQLADVSYVIDQERSVFYTNMKVNLFAKPGQTIKVRYFIDNPQKITYVFLRRLLQMLLCALGFFLLGLLTRVLY